MIPDEKSLEQLEQWMLTAITHPAGIEADTSADTASSVTSIVTPSQQQSAAERLNIYHHAYFARLLEVLRSLLPCTRYVVGDEQFDLFAVDYLQRHPPHSYTLTQLADHFADYLDATRPPDWGEFLVELVRLEHAIERIFDGPGPEHLPPFQLPPSGSENLRLQLVPSLELHSFRFPTSSFYTDWKANRSPTWPTMQTQWVALYRRDYIVRRVELSAIQFELLRALHRGESLLNAMQHACSAHADAFEDGLAEKVQSWFADWSARGIFAAALAPDGHQPPKFK